MAKRKESKRLERRDWERAALDSIAECGLSSLSIPKLAATLGVTKGSFYWHFEGLEALLLAALDRWERSYTDRRIEAFEKKYSIPADRLKPWSEEAENDHKAQALYLEITNAAAYRKDFSETVARVIEKRTAFIARAYRDLGLSPKLARRRAVIAYSCYAGMLQLQRVAPSTIGSEKDRTATVRDAMRLIGQK